MSSDNPPLDFSFKNLSVVDDVKNETPRKGVKKYKKTANGRYKCNCLRLNNNNLESVNGIHSIVNELLESPEKLTWLDLSFNKLSHLPSELSAFSNLKILYLHGNQLNDLSEVVRPLRLIDGLYSVTLHGNPMEEKKNYRSRVISNLPQIKTLDFTNVASADRKSKKTKTNQSPPTLSKK